jgi:uncharacterized protein
MNATVNPEKSESNMSNDVQNNKVLKRFELHLNGALAFANYRLVPGTVIITHTETPPELRGQGIASKLINGALDQIRSDGLKVIASCGFVAGYLEKHPEFADLVDSKLCNEKARQMAGFCLRTQKP